jgi:hypothetical protein
LCKIVQCADGLREFQKFQIWVGKVASSACLPASQPSFVLSFVTVKVKNCSFFRKLLGRKQLSWVDDDVEGLI